MLRVKHSRVSGNSGGWSVRKGETFLTPHGKAVSGRVDPAVATPACQVWRRRAEVAAFVPLTSGPFASVGSGNGVASSGLPFMWKGRDR